MSDQRFNTGNPIGSDSPLDRSDNTRNLDVLENSRTLTEHPDRFGVPRKTRHGMEVEFDASQRDRADRFNTFISSSGYQFAGDYAAGIEITEYNQLIRDSGGEFWRVSGQVDLPYVTTGAGTPEDDALVPAGDAAIRQQLANPSIGGSLISWIRDAVGAVVRTVRDKLSEHVSLFDYMTPELIADYKNVGSGTLDHTSAMIAAINDVKSKGGGVIDLPPGCLRVTRLPIESRVIWKGRYGSTFIECLDSTAMDAGVTHGSFIRKADDGTRAVRAGFWNLYIGARTSVAASEDIYEKIIGINLTACERTDLSNLTFAGFGYGGLVLARAEGGTEGLGFVNTVQDGNYNSGRNISFVSCGKHNPERAALWLKFKANSNKFFATFGKPARRLLAITHGNDNLFSGLTAETSESICYFGPLGWGNTLLGARAENLSSHAFDYDPAARNNSVIGGHYTGVSGNLLNGIEATEGSVAIIADKVWLGVRTFPPTANVSRDHDTGAVSVTSVHGDNNRPLIIKSPQYNMAGYYPVLQFWDSKTATTSGDTIMALEGWCSDSSAGASGVAASLRMVAEGSTGQTAIVFETGTASTRSEKMRLQSNGDLVHTVNQAQPSLTVNGTMSFRLFSDTELRVVVRGSDGVTRTASLTLA